MIYAKPGDTFTAVLQGAATGLAGTLGVRIERGDGTTATARTTAGIIELEAGSGAYAKNDLVAPGDAGTFIVLWDTGGGTPTFASEELVVNDLGAPIIPGAAGYPSRAALVAASTNDSLLALTPDQQDALRTAAITAVEAYAGQSFVPEGSEAEPVSKSVDGSGSGELQLPARLEVLTGLSVAGSSLGFDDVEVSEDGTQLYVPTDSIPGTWVTRTLRGNVAPTFRTGIRSVTITGVWGWEECPAAVATAIRYDMEDNAEAQSNNLAGTVAAWERLGIGSVSQGPVSLTIDGRRDLLSIRAQQVLDGADLVWQPLGEVV